MYKACAKSPLESAVGKRGLTGQGRFLAGTGWTGTRPVPHGGLPVPLLDHAAAPGDGALPRGLRAAPNGQCAPLGLSSAGYFKGGFYFGTLGECTPRELFYGRSARGNSRRNGSLGVPASCAISRVKLATPRECRAP